VARGAGLIERRLQADGDTRPLVVLDARVPATPEASELLDAAVRATASLVLELARRGGCGLLLPGEQRATKIDRELVAWPAAHARLAVVREEPPGRSGRGPALRSPLSRTGATIYVAASPVERLTGRVGPISTITAGPTVLVVPADCLVGGRPPGLRGPMRPAFVVSGCHGFALGVGRGVSRPVAERPMA
jgi:hypothetical protein